MGLFINLFPISLQFTISSFWLEDLDLTAGGVHMFQVLSMFVLSEGVYLDTEGNSLLPTMLPRGELSANAVDLDEDGCVLDGIPEELYSVELQWVSTRLDDTHREGGIYIQDPVPRPVPSPTLQLLMFCVLQAPVMKHHTHNALGLDKSEFLLAVLQRARWLHREHIGKENIWRHFLLRAVPPRVSGKAPKHLEYNLQLNAGGRALADCAKTTCFPVQRLKYPQKQRMGVGYGTLVCCFHR